MKLHITEPTFSFELLRAASYGLYGGSEIGEVLSTAKQIRQGDFESWYIAWQRTAARIEAVANQALDKGHRVSAGQAFLRASNYYRTAEFFLAPDDPRCPATFEKSRTTFWQFLGLSGMCVEQVRIPYEGTTLPGYFYRVDDSSFPRRALLALPGFDSTGEELYFFAAAAALQRGYNVLTIEGPGQGEPLRVQHLPARPDYEVPVHTAVDYLLTRSEVDPERIALMGTSMGGYYAARAAAFEPRLKALIVHSALFDLWATQTKTKPAFRLLEKWKSTRGLQSILNFAIRFNSELRWSVKNAKWVFGTSNPVEMIREIQRYSLKDIAGLVQQPTLILHGIGDHLFPLEQADMLYAALKAPTTMRVFTEEEGAEEHCQIGNMTLLHQVLFDWLDKTLLWIA